MKKERISEIVGKLGLYSKFVIADTVSKFEKLDYESIDDEKFDQWFNPEIFKQANNPGSYFISAVRRELKQGTFRAEQENNKESSALDPATLTPEPTESFEASWDEWCTLIRGLSLNPEMPSSPSMGVLISDSNNRVRAVSDGVGGMVYIDGTISERFKKYEDLDIQERQDLYAAVERLHSKQLGCELVLKRMSQLGGSINEQA